MSEKVDLRPEVLARVAIKVEPVGEQLAAEGVGATTTGVVQPNAYRTTPVVSLVGGIVRQVGAELGQHVERGQTLVVIFSDELAMSQSKYLTAQAELEEHHQHHRRTEELLEIGAASREELEQSTTKIRSAEAEVASFRQRLLFLGLSPQKVAALHSPSQVSSEVSLPAPVSGTIISRAANPGEVIEANKELLRVANLVSVWVIAQVYEKDLSRLQEAGVTVYTVRVGTPLPRSAGGSVLDRLASASGGQSFFPKNAEAMSEAFEEIALELRRQYSIGFTPSQLISDGQWHRLKVKVTPPPGHARVVVRSREGYYAAKTYACVGRRGRDVAGLIGRCWPVPI